MWTAATRVAPSLVASLGNRDAGVAAAFSFRAARSAGRRCGRWARPVSTGIGPRRGVARLLVGPDVHVARHVSARVVYALRRAEPGGAGDYGAVRETLAPREVDLDLAFVPRPMSIVATDLTRNRVIADIAAPLRTVHLFAVDRAVGLSADQFRLVHLLRDMRSRRTRPWRRRGCRRRRRSATNGRREGDERDPHGRRVHLRAAGPRAGARRRRAPLGVRLGRAAAGQRVARSGAACGSATVSRQLQRLVGRWTTDSSAQRTRHKECVRAPNKNSPAGPRNATAAAASRGPFRDGFVSWVRANPGP